MRPSPVSRIVSRSLLVRLVAPGLALLSLMAAAMIFMQWRTLERDNTRLAATLATFVATSLDEAFHTLETFVGRASPDGEPVRPGLLSDLLAVSPSFRRLLWITADGTVAQAVPSGLQGAVFPIDFDNQQNGRLLLSRPQPSPIDGRLVVSIGVRTATGGILAGELDLAGLGDRLTQLAPLAGGYILACDAYGNLIIHPEARLVAEQANIGDTPLFAAAKAGKHHLVYRARGRFWLGTVGVVDDCGWFVLPTVPVSELVAPALYTVAVLFVFMAGAFVLAWVLLRKALRQQVEEPLARFAASLPAGTSAAAGDSGAFAELCVFEGAFADMAQGLVKNERLFRSSFEQAAVGMAHVSTDGQWLLVNDRLCQLVGCSRQELLGHSLVEAIVPEDMAAVEARVEESLAGRLETFARQGRCIRPDGVSIQVNLTVSLVRDDAGRPDYFVFVVEDITERRVAEEALRQSLKDKELLLREVHHRVKNNLQVISSLFFLQAEVTANAEARAVLLESRTRIASMALVHEGLYRSGDFGHIDLADYVTRLAGQLQSSLGQRGGVCCKLGLEPIFVSIEKAAPLGLVLNELITNAIKHAYGPGQSGEVQVGARLEGDTIRVTVGDHGKGLPEGFSIEGTESLGMQLVANLTRQLQGQVRAENAGGARFTLIFPV
ncbi:sensor histidine kinase [Desulfovibrio sp. TomC]|uniref:sensor histidine kinase n=1 Tax=Desulfovibrio sp. TomC TaxID=1562888 RepID=UPI0005748BC7|nr:PAS domain S-box protein [Desulfovibrio sp. TomC]KHK02977.1 Sensory box histidine kinase/response regulator [Desulfovibrio sp. TomC]